MVDRWARLAEQRRQEARAGLRRAFDPERAAARARRRAAAANRRLERDAPLLLAAGVVQPIDEAQAAEQVQAHDEAVARHFERMAAAERRRAETEQWLRAFCAQLLTPAQLAQHDQARAKRPKAAAYGADLWGNLLRDLDPGLAAQCGYPPFDRLDVLNMRGAAAVGKSDPAYLASLQNDLAAADAQRVARHGEQLGLGL